MAETTPFDNYDLTDVRVEEARLLKGGALRSANMVMYIVIATTILLLLSERWPEAVIWFCGASTMIGITVLYARFMCVDGINRQNVGSYLSWHLMLTFTTGAVWGAFAIYTTDPMSPFHILISSFSIICITLGGMMRGAVYRPGYVVLLVPALIPFGLYLMLEGDAHAKVIGFGYFIYFAFGYYMSRPMNSVVRDGVVAQINRDAAQKLIEHQQEIKRLNEEKIRLMASISHDMTQPLIAQRHFLDSLSAKTKTNDQKQLLAKLEDVHDSQEQLLRQLVEHSQFERSEIIVKKEVFELSLLLEKLADEFTNRITEKAFNFQIELTPCEVNTDPLLVTRIVRNLLSNAMKYTPVGGHIMLTCQLEPDGIQIMVADNGPGIAEHEQEDIFKEYFRLENHENISGLGLGLSIVRKLAEILNGSISLQSEAGIGTRFYFKLDQNIIVQGYEKMRPEVAVKTPVVLVIGQNERKEFGGWENVTSIWLWRCFKIDNLGEVEGLLSTINLVPDLIVIDNLADKNFDPSSIREIKGMAKKDIPIIIFDSDNDEVKTTDLNVTHLPANHSVSEFKKYAEEVMAGLNNT